MVRTLMRGRGKVGGRGDVESDRGAGRGVSQGVGRGKGEPSDRGVGRFAGRGSGESGNQGVGRGSGLGSCETGVRGVRPNIFDQGVGRSIQSDAHYNTLMRSPIEDSDTDDGSQATSARRGRASQVELPKQVNRDTIWIEEGQFSNQEESTRIIGTILTVMWNGPWESWRDVPIENKIRMFERFKNYYKWDENSNVEIHDCFEKCIAGKFPDFLVRVRNEAKAKAIKGGLQVGDDLSVLTDFKPPFIRTWIWKQMVETWNTPEWKAKSIRNKKNRQNPIVGKHTLGSQSYVTAKRKAASILGRELSHCEMWMQSHCRKGCRPLDKYLNHIGEVKDLGLEEEDFDFGDFDLEGNLQEEDWVDDRPRETLVKYTEYLVKKYGNDCSKHPKHVDKELWSRACGGMKKGKVYGLSNLKDHYVHRQNSEIERLNGVIQKLVKEKEEEKERLNRVVTELVIEKETMENRMSSIEGMIKAFTQRGQSSS